MSVRSRRRAAAVILMVVLAVLCTASGGLAQQRRPAQLQVLGLDAVLREPDSKLLVRLAVRNPGPNAVQGLRVVTALHSRTLSRFDFRQAMEEDQVGAVVRRLEPTTLESLPAGATRTVELTATASELGVDQPVQQGVYPLRVTLERRGQMIDEVMTSLVAVPGNSAEPLRLALLIPVDYRPGLLADGTYHDRLPEALEPGGALDRLARELEVEARMPLTLAGSGYLLEQAGDLGDGYVAGRLQIGAEQRPARHAGAFLQRLRDIAGRPGVEQIAVPYGPADLVALVRRGLAMQARRELVSGVEAVERLTGQQVRADVLVPPDGLDMATLEMARAEGVRTVVLDERSLAIDPDRDLSTTPSPVRRLRSRARETATVLVPDPLLDEVLTRQPSAEGSVVDAQRILAETAAVYFERPFATEPRGLLIATPRQWDPPAGLVAGLLAATRSAPWLMPVDLSTLQREVEADPQPTKLAYPPEALRRELDRAYLGRLAEVRGALGSLGAVLEDQDAMADRLDRLLLAAAAVWYRAGPLQPEGKSRIDEAQQGIDQVYGSVRVEDQSVTLTSIEGQQVPVTITSEAEVPLRVRVRLQAQPIAFEEGNTQVAVLQPGVSTTLTFAARILTPGGTFAANVYVEDPQGVRRLAQGRIQVRSATYSMAALVLTVGAGAFLLAWWLREAVRRRREGDGPGRARAA